MDDAVPIGVDHTQPTCSGGLLDDNADAQYGHRHGDPGTIRARNPGLRGPRRPRLPRGGARPALGRDITYLRTWEGWLHLVAVQDIFSRRVVGWSMADHMRAELVTDALQMALAQRRPPPG